jgi:hypothetical protein
MSRLYILTNSPLGSLYQLLRHIMNAKDFPAFAYISSNITPYNLPLTAGVSNLATPPGGGSFFYWAWVSNHYRHFGDLIDYALSINPSFTLPYPVYGSSANPSLTLLNTLTGTAAGLTSVDQPVALTPYSNTNTMFTVQSAGYYYLTAARCSEERHKRFKAASGVIFIFTKVYPVSCPFTDTI